LRLAIKIGGSVAVGADGPKTEYVSRLKRAIEALEFEKLVVGIGGGRFARKYLRAVGPLLTPDQAESLVIDLLRANTRFLALVLGGKAILDEEELSSLPEERADRLLVVGGIRPGRSTDANTALLAKATKADLFVKLTDVDGIYTADPDLDDAAELIERMTYDQALDMSVAGKPGSYGILDRLALEALRGAGIPARVIPGRDPQDLVRLLAGAELGTLITEDP
jgi:uridylate kinase